MQNAPSITESNLPNNDPLTTPVVQELMGTIQKQQHEIEQLWPATKKVHSMLR